jgi:putative DNA methylase
MRAVIFASLAPPTSEAFNLTEQLSSDLTPKHDSLRRARQLLKQSFDRPPRILDVFSGAGTIPFEAARLGCSSVSLELNPLAVFLQRTVLQYSQADNKLAELGTLVDHYGRNLLKTIEAETDETYRRPREPGAKRLVFIWGQTVTCRNCGRAISLSRMGWISKKKNRTVFLDERPDASSGSYIRKLTVNPVSGPETKHWKTATGIVCPFCLMDYKRIGLQELTKKTLREQLLVVCYAGNVGRYKTFAVPDTLDNFYPTSLELDDAIAAELKNIGEPLPKTQLPVWSGIVNPPLYGISTHTQMFNQRQLLVLLKIIRGLRETYHRVLTEFSPNVALATVALLSGFVDQLVDWNCRLSMWIEENEQVGRALSGPGIPMLWNYAETDPFSDGPANLYDKLARIISAIGTIPEFTAPVEIQLGSATENVLGQRKFDAVVTDPPYGDNLFYSVLANCIYVWKRMVFRDILPELFGVEQTSELGEVVAAHFGRASFAKAMEAYEEGLGSALEKASGMLETNGVLSLVFAHSTIEAWEVVIRTFRRARLAASACWPMIVERRARPRGMAAQAVNVSFVIVGRPREYPLERHAWDWILKQVESSTSALLNDLTEMGWSESDIGTACFGKAASIFTTTECVEGEEFVPLRNCLERTAQSIMRRVPALTLQRRV